MNKPFFQGGGMCRWASALVFSCFVFTGVHCAQCHSAPIATPKQNIQIKVIGARTDSRLGKYTGVVEPKARARVVLVHIQVPAGLEISTSYPHKDQNEETVDETFNTLRDSKGKDYLNDYPQSLGISNPNKNNIQTISWIAPYEFIALQKRKSLRFKVKLYFFKRASKNIGRQMVESRLLDIPVRYYS